MENLEALPILNKPTADLRPFKGFRPPTSSTTYTPNQFFDVVLPRASRGCLRLVAYLIRKTLGWSDEEGNPLNPAAHVSFRELIEEAGISRGAIKSSLQEALDCRYIQCMSSGQPHLPGREGFSAHYSLNWDEGEDYVTDPELFNGFFSGNGNLTHIPNQFFDEVVPSETLAVVRVVGAVIRNTIGFQTKFGFRRQNVQLSFSDIMRKTGISSSSTVSSAVKSAVELGYIQKVSPGVFDPNAGMDSRSTTFSPRWQDSSLHEPEKDHGITARGRNQFRNRSGPCWRFRKSKRGISPKSEAEMRSEIEAARVQKPKAKAFRNRSGIETTSLNNRSKQQQKDDDERSLLVSDLLTRLTALGLGEARAAELLKSHPREQILRQLDALPHRRIQSSVTGFLISAIQQDFPLPHVLESPAGSFASHFYAELAGNWGAPAALPSAADEASARRLVALVPCGSPEEGGREFARFVKSRADEKSQQAPSLAASIRKFGDLYAKLFQPQTTLSDARNSMLKEEHRARYGSAYQGWLKSLAHSIEEGGGDEWLEFTKWMEARIERGGQLSAKYARMCREKMGAMDGRADLLIEFLREEKASLVPSFWEWDASHNPSAFAGEKEGAR